MNYILYQLKVAGILFIFYIIYRSFISNSSEFRYKRIFILGSLALAYIVPFLKIQVQPSKILTYYQKLPAVVINAYSNNKSIDFNLQFWGFSLFTIISLFIFYHAVRQLIAIITLIRTSPKTKEKGITLVVTKGQDAFTFFKYVFIGKLIPEANQHIILQHEKVHAKYLHSLDNLLFEMVMVMQWFNPAVWLFHKAVKQNHEYEADRFLIDNGISVLGYQQLLLNQMFQTKNIRFSSFNYNSFIKNRIKMMTKAKSPAGKTRFLLATIMCLFVVSVFSFKAESVKNNLEQGIVSLNVSEQVKDTLKQTSDEVPYLTVDEPATFRGKDLTEFNKYLGENIKYPLDAVKNKIQGKVIVQFIVEKDGSIKESKILRGTSPTLDEEAIRVVKSSPKWEPAKYQGKLVRQAFTLPVIFSLK